MVAIRMEHFRFHVGSLGLEFLDADHVRVLLRQPVKEALAGRRANTVKICRYNTQH